MNLFLKFWFPVYSPYRLALLRIVLGFFSWIYILPEYPSMLAFNHGPADLFEPVGILSGLQSPLPDALIHFIIWLTLISGLGFIIGWHYTFTAPIYAFGFLICLTYQNSWTMIYHSDNALVLHLLILAFSPAAEVLSRKPKSLVVNPSGKFGWPIRLICTVTVSIYVLSALAKLLGFYGWSWIDGEVLRNWIAYDSMRKELLGTDSALLSTWIYQHPIVAELLGFITIVLELGAPVALFHPLIGYIWCFSVLMMHWGILFMMNISFTYQLIGFIFISFFPLERCFFSGVNATTSLEMKRNGRKLRQ